MARQSLAGWIGEALVDTEKEGAISMLACVHYVGSAEKEVHHITFAAGKQWTGSELAELFDAKAKSFAQDLPGTQLFGLQAFYGGRSSPEATHPFRILGENFYESGGTDTPDAKGLVAQSMRHTEAMVQMSARAMLETNATLLKMNDQLADENLKLKKENFDAISVVKEMVLKDVRETHELHMKELEFKRASVERQKWFLYGPALVNQLLGKEIFPQSTADTALVETVAASLKPEHIEKLAAILPPHLMGPLATRIQQFLDKKAEETRSDIKALKGMDPEEDAAGGPE